MSHVATRSVGVTLCTGNYEQVPCLEIRSPTLMAKEKVEHQRIDIIVVKLIFTDDILFSACSDFLQCSVVVNPLDARRRLTDISQTSYAAGSRLTYKTVNQRSGSSSVNRQNAANPLQLIGG